MTDSQSADAVWRKSKQSNSQGECVEVRFAGDAVLVRHSLAPSGPVLAFSRAEWNAFLAGARDGEFDLP